MQVDDNPSVDVHQSDFEMVNENAKLVLTMIMDLKTIQTMILLKKEIVDMINKIPKKFNYNANTENLFLFYQRVSELLFDYSPDSYKVTSHNTHTLISEAYNTFMILKKDGVLSKYYESYIPNIVEELITLLRKDDVAKELLDLRFEKYISLFEASLKYTGSDNEMRSFETLIVNFKSYFNGKSYYEKLTNKLIGLITMPKHQQELIVVTNDFLCELMYLGYSKQHIYNSVVNYFCKEIISDPKDGIEHIVGLFDFKEKEWDIVSFANSKVLDYYNDHLSEVIKSENAHLDRLDDDALEEIILGNQTFSWLKETLNDLRKVGMPVSLVRIKAKALDPYIGYNKANEFINTIGDLITTFDNELKASYSSIACLNYSFKKTIKVKRSMEKRPIIRNQNLSIDVSTALKKMKMSSKMFMGFLKLSKLHSDAINNSVDEQYTLVTLWTSLESLFADGVYASKAKMVTDGLLAIIQRSYIVKCFMYLQYDLIRHLKDNNYGELIERHSIDNLEKFILIMFSPPTDTAVTDIMITLKNNPLLRCRIFYLIDCCLKDGSTVLEFIKKHNKKITWQIARIYRARNFVVHGGRRVPFVPDLVENLHDYVDFTMNFMINKSLYGEHITNVGNLVAEIQMDISIHQEILVANPMRKTSESIMENLFGPSTNVMQYYSIKGSV